MTFVLDGLCSSGKLVLRKELMQKGNAHALQAVFPLRRRLLPVRGLLRKSSTPKLLLFLQSGGQAKNGGSRCIGALTSGSSLLFLGLGLSCLLVGLLCLGFRRSLALPLVIGFSACLVVSSLSGLDLGVFHLYTLSYSSSSWLPLLIRMRLCGWGPFSPLSSLPLAIPATGAW